MNLGEAVLGFDPAASGNFVATLRRGVGFSKTADSDMKRALITGITGQDGSFLAELLLEKGYQVFGLARRESWYRHNNASHLAGRIEVLFGDMSERVDIASAIQDAKPDEI